MLIYVVFLDVDHVKSVSLYQPVVPAVRLMERHLVFVRVEEVLDDQAYFLS